MPNKNNIQIRVLSNTSSHSQPCQQPCYQCYSTAIFFLKQWSLMLMCLACPWNCGLFTMQIEDWLSSNITVGSAWLTFRSVISCLELHLPMPCTQLQQWREQHVFVSCFSNLQLLHWCGTYILTKTCSHLGLQLNLHLQIQCIPLACLCCKADLNSRCH